MPQPAAILNTSAELQTWLADAPQPLVFTNGCFDILHRGHVQYLQQAAALGAGLIVALNTDASVKRQGKGDDRPMNILEDRMAVMAALGCVDAVCAFEEDTPLKLILACQPQVLVKGGDWPIDSIVGCTEVQAWGGKCHSIAFEFERSTTQLIKKIRQV
ncbi:MAG: D-glycero-beta-D-manno-heptose 1-phosphate adenylyltransferase [Arenicellales bacterium]